MAIKRNASAEFSIEIGIPYKDVESIELLFKKEKKSNYPELLKKSYSKDEIEVEEDTATSFTMVVKLKPDETFRFTEGRLYMDTRIVLNDGTVPAVEIERLDDVWDTLFSEAYYDKD